MEGRFLMVDELLKEDLGCEVEGFIILVVRELYDEYIKRI